MKVKDFVELVRIWELASLDSGTKYVHLLPEPLSAHFQGLHCEARRDASPAVEIDNFDEGLGLDGVGLTGILALMEEDDSLTAEVVKSGLLLRATGQRTGLRKTVIEARPMLEAPDDSQVIDIKQVRQAVNFLLGCTAEGVLSPILAGIRFTSSSKGNLILVATDGERRTGRALVKASLGIEGEPVVPALDLLTALNIMDDKVGFSFTERSLFLTDAVTVVRMSLLQSSKGFPAIHMLPREFAHSFQFPSSCVDTAVRAATLLDADKLVSFVIKDGVATLGVVSQEMGAFRIAIGNQEVDDIAILFDAYWLVAAERMGKEVELRYNAPNKPVLFVGKDTGYLLWMSPVVRM